MTSCSWLSFGASASDAAKSRSASKAGGCRLPGAYPQIAPIPLSVLTLRDAVLDFAAHLHRGFYIRVALLTPLRAHAELLPEIN
jgi:hypothetical protein